MLQATHGSTLYRSLSLTVAVLVVAVLLLGITACKSLTTSNSVTAETTLAGAVITVAAVATAVTPPTTAGATASTAHTATTSHTGGANATTSATSPPSGYSWHRYDDTNSRLVRSGPWNDLSPESMEEGYGGTIAFLADKGYMEFRFEGTQVKVRGVSMEAGGWAEITIDPGQAGQRVFDVDCYGPVQKLGQLWVSPALSAGMHDVLIEWAGNKDTQATDYQITVDEVDILGNLE